MKRLLMLLLASAVVSASALFLFWSKHSKPYSGLDLRLPTGIGEVMAEEAAKFLSSGGSVLVLSFETAGAPALQAQLDAFRRELGRTPTITIAAAKLFGPEELAIGDAELGFTARRWQELVEAHPNTDLIVSFIGEPDLTGTPKLPVAQYPKMLVLTSQSELLDKALRHGLVQTAVISVAPAPQAAASATSREAFAQHYRVIHAAK